MSDSLKPHGLKPARLLCPWNFRGKNTGEGCHAPPPGDLPNPQIEPVSLVSYVRWQADCLPLRHLGNWLVKNLPAKAGKTRKIRVQSLGWEDPLEKEMASHSTILAWKTPWTEEPGRLQFIGWHKVGHD